MKSIKMTTLCGVLLLASGFTAAAQDTLTMKKDRYTLQLLQKGAPLSNDLKSKISDGFFKAYPAFARADGYRTKREVVMEVSPDYKGTITAGEGQIVVNQQWLEKNSGNFEKALQYKLADNWVSADTVKKKGYSLVFVNKDPNLDLKVKQKLIETYFKVYPTLVKTYNPQSTKDVLFVVDTAYKAVAEASGGRILFSAGYLKANPTDIDVVTHETMHIAQGYGYNAGPGWLTEGLADYIRYKHGVDNVGSKWSLPAFTDKHHYTNSYRITARFFAWIEKNVKPGMIKTLDSQLRKHTYSDESWKALSGQTLDELWSAYSLKPMI